MPNWCFGSLIITCSEEQRETIRTYVQGDEIVLDLNRIIPIDSDDNVPLHEVCNAFALLGKYVNRPVSEIPPKALARFQKLGFHPIIKNNVLKTMSSEFLTPTPLALLEEIDKKIEKLQGPNYLIFRKNRLFVFVLNPISCCFTRSEIRELARVIKEHQRDAVPKFDAIYVYDSYNGIYDLWVCYPQSETVRKYTGVPFR